MADPLGTRPQFTEARSLPRWSSTEPDALPELDPQTLPNAHVINPFPVRDDLNDKIALWVGDVASLSVEVVVNPTNENLTDKNPVSSRLLEVAGPELREECKSQIGNCRTGEAKITGAYKLPARYVIHTVGPRYNIRYKTAAESALYNCYRSVMQIVKSRRLATIAFSTLNSSRRGYPPEEGAHMAMRTIRRFLEHFGDTVDVVVFVADKEETVYDQVLPVYFPRTKEEQEWAAPIIPADIGNEFGEPIIPERGIRILDNPVEGGDGSEGSGEESEEVEEDEERGEGGLVEEVGSHPFSAMTPDQDQERRTQLVRSRPPTVEELQQRKYQEFLHHARTGDFSDIATLNVFYKAGLDFLGRPIVIFVGNRFPAPNFDLSRAKAYFIKVMETIVHRDYIIVYFNSACQSDRLPDSNFFKDLYNMVDPKYKRHLKALYIVHPTFWFKVQAWWFLTFTGSEIKDRVHYLTGVQYLFDSINPDQIEIPQFVLDHDTKVNGSNYYSPGSKGEEASGGL